MGGTASTPTNSPLSCILNDEDHFDPDNLKKKCLVFYYYVACSQYQLGSQEKWLDNTTLGDIPKRM
jgi:hypothetical protein